MRLPSLRLLCALIAVVGLSACSAPAHRDDPSRAAGPAAQQSPTPAIQVKRDLAYASGGPEFTLDIAYPAEPATPRPLLVYVPANSFGIDFSYSSTMYWKGSYADLIQEAAAKGYVAAAINHRRINILFLKGSAYPLGALVDDLRSALAWLAAHAADYGIDPARIAVLGWSSGGHLALAASYGMPGESMTAWTAAPGFPAIKAVVCSSGVPDDGAFMAEYLKNPAAFQVTPYPEIVSMLRDLYGGDYPERRAAYEAGTPIRFVRPACPPTFLLHGGLDKSLDPKYAVALDEALSKAGVRHSLRIFPHAAHRSFLLENEVWDFLSAELKP